MFHLGKEMSTVAIVIKYKMLKEINCDNRRRRIMTAEDIEAELDQESNYTDFDSDSEDDDWILKYLTCRLINNIY